MSISRQQQEILDRQRRLAKAESAREGSYVKSLDYDFKQYSEKFTGFTTVVASCGHEIQFAIIRDEAQWRLEDRLAKRKKSVCKKCKLLAMCLES